MLNNEIVCIEIGSLVAYATYVSEKEFGQQAFEKNLKNIDWVKNKALIHQQLVDEVFQQVTIIPLKFGSVFTSEEQLIASIKPKINHYLAILDQIEGKSEWSLKLYFDKDKLDAALQKSDEMQQVQNTIANASPGKQFLLKKSLEKQKKELLKVTLNRYRKEAYAGFKNLMQECKVKDNQSQEMTGNPDQMILNVVGLQSNKDTAENLQQIFKEKYTFPEGIYSSLTGPWPPYNFLQI